MNEKLIFSKLEKLAFPVLEKIVEEAIKVALKQPPTEVTDIEKDSENNSCCTIL